MTDHRLRRRWRAKAKGISAALPEPFDIDQFCRNLGELRNRPIRLLPLDRDQASSPCGLWLQTATRDYVFYDPDSTPFHRDHIILHEVAHILCDHDGAEGSVAGRLLTPNLDAKLVRRILGRSVYETAEEREAEELAARIRRLAERRTALYTSPTSKVEDAVVRFDEMLANGTDHV